MQGINEHKADIITQLQMQEERGGGLEKKRRGFFATWILQKSCDSFIRLLEYVECYHRRRMLYRTGYQSILTIFWLFTIKYTLYIRIWIRCTYVYSCNENNCVLALCDVIKQ